MTDNSRSIRLTADLRIVAHHVSYEIEVLIYAADELGGWHSSPMTTPAGDRLNVLMESYLLHFRNLRAFLCPSMQGLREDDIIATDFLDRAQPADMGDASKFRADKERLDGMLTHLTYRRHDYIKADRHSWPIASMTTTILGEVSSFLRVLPADRQEWFPSIPILAECIHRADSKLYLEEGEEPVSSSRTPKGPGAVIL